MTGGSSGVGAALVALLSELGAAKVSAAAAHEQRLPGPIDTPLMAEFRATMSDKLIDKKGSFAGASRPGPRSPARVRSYGIGADPGGAPEMGVPMGTVCVALVAVLAFANLPAIAFAQSACPGIHVKILNIRNSTGGVACALFESPVGFPTEFLHSATNIMVIKVRHTRARCDFEDIPPGRYSLAVIHDENMNGKLDTNWLGVPTEGYGFSNDAGALLGAPSFSAASFLYDGQNLELTLGLHY